MVSRCSKHVIETEAEAIGESMEVTSKVSGKSKK